MRISERGAAWHHYAHFYTPWRACDEERREAGCTGRADAILEEKKRRAVKPEAYRSLTQLAEKSWSEPPSEAAGALGW